MPGEFTLIDRYGVCHAIDQLEPSVRNETFGGFVALDGNQETQGTFLIEKAKEFEEK